MVLKILSRTNISHGRARKPTVYLETELGNIPTTTKVVYGKRVPHNRIGQKNIKGSHLQVVFVEDLIRHGKLTKIGEFSPNSIN